MEMTTRETWLNSSSLVTLRIFSIWTFTLTVCLLVVGFPLVVLMATIGAIFAIALQSILPMSAVLLVAGCLIGANLFLVLCGAAALTVKGVNPREVRWLTWLHGEPDPLQTPVYAACPLTCAIGQ
ncbi:MAG TPA: hypothetical protein DEG17_07685 [Cyanobacteria bacterium UBA11149]|nr:hypothetical protein [Cyanobacteria bacterium UBA11367]HBE60606.1 hypothetical protein [Cyanobacteria bacterium UBA11366]HBK63471.1 hypothetical protein [Cyanobacteria bacterium UBA11166]HBR73371.1 hypothetical protein [Cyanobacteria bacterium UBA11159]HBS68003.1 hypothetical protein [Cyanobacteria bacterium UBA11153]HBW88743.1 hypothetical protein [Cyanobacteria bacterium UBA11149]HCA96203.1 hypothetical protein [Cyanobacteria bacterium UBA9226]